MAPSGASARDFSRLSATWVPRLESDGRGLRAERRPTRGGEVRRGVVRRAGHRHDLDEGAGAAAGTSSPSAAERVKAAIARSPDNRGRSPTPSRNTKQT